MSRTAQNWGLATPTPIGKGVSGYFAKKLFWLKVNVMSRTVHETLFLPTPHFS